MRCAVACGAALMFSVAMPSAAQEFKPPANLFGQKTPAPKPPKIDWNWRPPVEQAQAPGAMPLVVCGMTLVPADPKVDPKMRVETPERGVAFTMHVVSPTLCKPW